MEKYVVVDWPAIQDFMDHKDYPKEVGFDPEKNIWFVPEHMIRGRFNVANE